MVGDGERFHAELTPLVDRADAEPARAQSMPIGTCRRLGVAITIASGFAAERRSRCDAKYGTGSDFTLGANVPGAFQSALRSLA